MSCQVYFENVFLPNINFENVSLLKTRISQQYGVSCDDLFVTINGKSTTSDLDLKAGENVVRVFTRLLGEKGGFGSMLRAIGAQIQKTTNREPCRDLSGRRLRDIHEETRLKKWLEGQDEREKEAVERKQKKLESLAAEPKIEVTLNSVYEKERQELSERVGEAVDAGWQAARASKGTKRKADGDKLNIKKMKFWIDADLSDCSLIILSEDEEDEDVKKSPPEAVSTDSGNDLSKGTKRKADGDKLKTEKMKFWIDADLSGCSLIILNEDEEDEDVKKSPPEAMSTDSGNDLSKGTKRKADGDKLKTEKMKFWIDADLSGCSLIILSEDKEDEDVKESPPDAVSTDSGND